MYLLNRPSSLLLVIFKRYLLKNFLNVLLFQYLFINYVLFSVLLFFITLILGLNLFKILL